MKSMSFKSHVLVGKAAERKPSIDSLNNFLSKPTLNFQPEQENFELEKSPLKAHTAFWKFTLMSGQIRASNHHKISHGKSFNHTWRPFSKICQMSNGSIHIALTRTVKWRLKYRWLSIIWSQCCISHSHNTDHSLDLSNSIICYNWNFLDTRVISLRVFIYALSGIGFLCLAVPFKNKLGFGDSPFCGIKFYPWQCFLYRNRAAPAHIISKMWRCSHKSVICFISQPLKILIIAPVYWLMVMRAVRVFLTTIHNSGKSAIVFFHFCTRKKQYCLCPFFSRYLKTTLELFQTNHGAEKIG